MLQEPAIIKFAEKIRDQNVDGTIITGDISTSREFVFHLSAFETITQRPVYFVLGNHDYWGSMIEDVQKKAFELSSMSTFVKWAASTPYITLTPSTALVGHDGWYDALTGPPDFSIGLNDWLYIRDFAGQHADLKKVVNFNRDTVISVSRALAHKATVSIMQSIKAATRYANRIIVITHVPPVACHENDQVGNSWFLSKMMGDMLLQAAKAYPNVQFTVLAGHTHKRGQAQIDKNMVCFTGEATYGKPIVEKIIEVV
jgi:predicted phosphohydrolase